MREVTIASGRVGHVAAVGQGPNTGKVFVLWEDDRDNDDRDARWVPVGDVWFLF